MENRIEEKAEEEQKEQQQEKPLENKNEEQKEKKIEEKSKEEEKPQELKPLPKLVLPELKIEKPQTPTNKIPLMLRLTEIDQSSVAYQPTRPMPPYGFRGVVSPCNFPYRQNYAYPNSFSAGYYSQGNTPMNCIFNSRTPMNLCYPIHGYIDFSAAMNDNSHPVPQIHNIQAFSPRVARENLNSDPHFGNVIGFSPSHLHQGHNT